MTAQDRVENYGRSRPPTGGAGYRPPHTGAGYRLERKNPPSPQLVGCRFDVVGGNHADHADFVRRSDARRDLLFACLLNDSARGPPGQDRLQWIRPHFGPAGREGRGGT